MNKVSGWLSAPSTGVLIGIITFVLSVAIAYWLYRKALPVSRLDYVLVDGTILSQRFSAFEDDIEIRFKGQPVPRVTSTTVAFWNSGNQTIMGSQVVERDKLRLLLANHATVLQTVVVASTRKVVDPKVESIGQETVIISFDFLDPGDGFAIFATHSGAPNDAVVAGTLRGVRGGPRRSRGTDLPTVAVAALITGSFAILSWMLVKLVPQTAGWQSAAAVGTTIGFVLFSASAPNLARWQRLRSFPKDFRREPRLSGMLPHLLDG